MDRIEEALASAKAYRMVQRRYQGKWRDPWTRAWQTKTLPKHLWVAQDDFAALEWLRAWLRETLSRGGVGAPNSSVAPKPDLLDLLPRWREHRLSLGKLEAEVGADERGVERWIGDLRGVPVEDITVPLAAAWAKRLGSESGKAPLTVRNIVACFRALVVDARGLGWVQCPSNPFADDFIRKVLPEMRTLANDAVVFLRPEQMHRLASTEGPRRLLNLVAMGTGMREGELVGLAWEHVDLQQRIVRVVRQLRGKAFKPPKYGSKRLVPLHPALSEALANARPPAAVPSAPVFPRPSDGGYGSHVGARGFREDLVMAGLPPSFTTDEGMRVPFTFHATRRSFLSALSVAGVPDDDRRVLAGHRRVGVTNAAYTAKDLDRLRAAVASLPF